MRIFQLWIALISLRRSERKYIISPRKQVAVGVFHKYRTLEGSESTLSAIIDIRAKPIETRMYTAAGFFFTAARNMKNVSVCIGICGPFAKTSVGYEIQIGFG